MITHSLPQTGWLTADEWAAALGEQVPTFTKKIKRLGIPHKKWGNTLLIRAEDFYDALQWRGTDNE